MANSLNQVMPKVLAQALEVLRETAIATRVVNTDYGSDAAKKGGTVDVQVTSSLEATDVVPGPTSSNTQDVEPTVVPIKLDYWKESAFAMTDKDLMEVESGILNRQVEEAAKAVANAIDLSVLNLYKRIPNFIGTPGTTPFSSSTLEAQRARAFLNKHRTPTRDRHMILDVDAEANASGLPAFQNAEKAGTDLTIREGDIGRKVGFDWHYDQLNPYHTAGTITPKSAGPLTVGATALGATSLVVDGLTSGGVVEGDIFRVAGDDQTYVIKAAAAVVTGAVTFTFYPEAQQSWADNSAVTFEESHMINLALHRDCLALAIRPLAQQDFENELGGRVMSMTDPVTGIPLRLEVRREHKRVRWAIDALWGAEAIRPLTGCRIAG